MYTDFSSAECRLKAETNLDLAARGGAMREQLLVDAAGWLLLADHLDFIECARTGVRTYRVH
jgi:hypothetical protein